MKKVRAWVREWLGIEALEDHAREERKALDEWIKEFQAEMDERLEKLEKALMADGAKSETSARSNGTTGYVPWSQRRAMREARNTNIAVMAQKIKSALKE